MDALRRILRLLWAPGTLAEAAVRVPTFAALAAGILAGAMIAAGVLWPTAINIRPATTGAAALFDLRAVLLALAMGLGLSSTTGVAVWGALAGGARTVKGRAVMRAVLLSPVAWTIPVLLWAPAGAIAECFGPASSRADSAPAWMRSTAIHMLGSRWWLLAAILAHVWLLRHASWRLHLMFSRDARTCPGCGYNLAGLDEEPRCPECGHARGTP